MKKVLNFTGVTVRNNEKILGEEDLILPENIFSYKGRFIDKKLVYQTNLPLEEEGVFILILPMFERESFLFEGRNDIIFIKEDSILA